MSDLISPSSVAALLPEPTIDAVPFWAACDRAELELPFCAACDRFFYPPRLFCPRCASRDVAYRTADGNGRIHSFVHVAFSPFGDFWKQDLPYTVVRVDLTNGVRFLARLVGDDRQEAAIGDPVAMRFAPVRGSDHKVPVFVRDAPKSSHPSGNYHAE